jgi:hypothetical protein
MSHLATVRAVHRGCLYNGSINAGLECLFGSDEAGQGCQNIVKLHFQQGQKHGRLLSETDFEYKTISLLSQPENRPLLEMLISSDGLLDDTGKNVLKSLRMPVSDAADAPLEGDESSAQSRSNGRLAHLAWMTRANVCLKFAFNHSFAAVMSINSPFFLAQMEMLY